MLLTPSVSRIAIGVGGQPDVVLSLPGCPIAGADLSEKALP